MVDAIQITESVRTDNQLGMATEADLIAIARSVLATEANAILAAEERVNGSLAKAVALMLKSSAKVIVTGVGKSGYVGRKIAATLCSTGTPSVFLHPSEALHGDLGVYSSGDPTILLSKSGTTDELLRLVPILREFGSPLIGIIGNTASSLARQCDVVLDAAVTCEADPNNLAPTSSTTLAMALGDALAIALMQAKRFTAEDFAKFHPGGQLGRNMRLRVADVMHGGNKVAWVGPETSLRQVVIEMTQLPLGAALVIDSSHKLLGLITDGDLRRTLIAHEDIRLLKAADFMTANPLTVSTETLLKDALRVMEDRPSQISVLPVVEERNQLCSGLIRIHDIYLPTLG